MSQKRPDIQGLRCICILMVLLYHYYPRIFPQGRLGVDMFFVISGFLIALMLSKKKNGIVAYFFQFYWRRIKRILPLCYLVFFVSYTTMYLLKLKVFVYINKDFGAKALLFMANVKISDEDQYEAQLTGATVLLTHYWSLSTEIQFYLLAPVIVLCVLKQCTMRKNIFFSFLAIASFLHYLTTSTTIAFNSPFARLWQFMAGFIAYYNCADETPGDGLENEALPICNEERKLVGKEDVNVINVTSSHLLSYFSLFIVCTILFIPSPTFFLDTLFRVSVTLSTMWTLMAVDKNPKFLGHPLSVYMGDISFALYLVHWPILCFLKSDAVEDPCLRKLAIPIALLLSMLLAVVLHETFEKRYLQCSLPCIMTIILVLIIGCSCLVFFEFGKTNGRKGKEDFFETAIRLNHEKNIVGIDEHMTSKVAQLHQLDGFDDRKRLFLMEGGTGNLTILIIGNSYAGNQADVIFNGLKKLHNKVFNYYTHGCETLLTYDWEDNLYGCVSSPMKNAELIERLKPDLLFIVERGINIKANLTSDVVLEDKYMQEMSTNLEIFQKFTKRIFILGPFRSLYDAPVTKAIKILGKKQRLKDAPSLVHDDNLSQRIRLAKLAEVCRKCIVYEWEHVFYNEHEQFEPFNPDTDLLYFDNYMHLGEEGLKKMEPFYENMEKEMLIMWKKNLLFL